MNNRRRTRPVNAARYSRRAMLAGLGTSAALLPFVPILETQAATDGPTKRLVLFFTSNGLYRDSLRPGSPGAFDIDASVTLQPLKAYADRMLFVDGVDFAAHLAFAGGTGGDHHPGYAMCMTGHSAVQQGNTGSTYFPDGPSLDHFVANRLPGSIPFKSQNVGVGDNLQYPYGRVFWRGAGERADVETNPATQFDKMFGGVDLEQGEALALAKQRSNVLDSVSERLNLLKGRLGSSDSAKLEAHLDGLTDLQAQLQAPACAPPTLVTSADAYKSDGEKHIDIIAKSFACDLTRVATMQWDRVASLRVFPEISPFNHHDINHYKSNLDLTEEIAYDLATQIDTWYATRLARLCDKLDEIPEGDGTSVLDNTTILWCSEHAWPFGHIRYDLPYIMVGGGGGYFNTGQYVGFDGANNNDLYISLCHSMGLTDVNVFGHPDLCTGPLPGLAK